MKTLFFYLVFSLVAGSTTDPSPITPCTQKPIVKKKKIVSDDFEDWYQYFYASVNSQRVLLKNPYETGWADCNSSQSEIGDHAWNGDTLLLYTYWFHDGDPTGKRWGAKLAKYYWNCQEQTFHKLGAILYLEIMGEPGSMPLSKAEMSCRECVQERENYKQKMSRSEKAHFVVGTEARTLIKQTQKFLYRRLVEAEKHSMCETSSFGCRIWE